LFPYLDGIYISIGLWTALSSVFSEVTDFSSNLDFLSLISLFDLVIVLTSFLVECFSSTFLSFLSIVLIFIVELFLTSVFDFSRTGDFEIVLLFGVLIGSLLGLSRAGVLLSLIIICNTCLITLFLSGTGVLDRLSGLLTGLTGVLDLPISGFLTSLTGIIGFVILLLISDFECLITDSFSFISLFSFSL